VLRLPRPTGRQLIWLAGIGLVIAGITFLYLSDVVARPGSWWQGTLDAFGVGFVVGGIVDVVSISLLNQVLTGVSQQPWNAQAMSVLSSIPDPYGDGEDPVLFDASMLLGRFGDKLDPALRRGLEERLEGAPNWEQDENGFWYNRLAR
jgi:hypothetical protein